MYFDTLQYNSEEFTMTKTVMICSIGCADTLEGCGAIQQDLG